MMVQRRFLIVLGVLGILLGAGGPALAADKTHEGYVLKAGVGQLTMTDKDGKNKHTHGVAADAKITCDGKACKLEDLREGFCVKVTIQEDANRAVKVEAKAEDTHEGKVAKAGDGKLVMTDRKGENRHTHDVPIDAQITSDGKGCKLEDLKEGFFVVVMTKDAGKKVTRIEARTKD